MEGRAGSCLQIGCAVLAVDVIGFNGKGVQFQIGIEAPAGAKLVFCRGTGEPVKAVIIRTAKAEEPERMKNKPGVKIFGRVVVQGIDTGAIEQLNIVVQKVAVLGAEEAAVQLDADVAAVLVADGIDKTVGCVAFSGNEGI